MKKKLTVLMAAMTIVAGVSMAGDHSLPREGLINDAEYTRENGGVGNYLFRYTKDETIAEAPAPEADPVATNYEEAPTEPVASTESDDISLGASSSGRAH